MDSWGFQLYDFSMPLALFRPFDQSCILHKDTCPITCTNFTRAASNETPTSLSHKHRREGLKDDLLYRLLTKRRTFTCSSFYCANVRRL